MAKKNYSVSGYMNGKSFDEIRDIIFTSDDHIDYGGFTNDFIKNGFFLYTAMMVKLGNTPKTKCPIPLTTPFLNQYFLLLKRLQKNGLCHQKLGNNPKSI